MGVENITLETKAIWVKYQGWPYVARIWTEDAGKFHVLNVSGSVEEGIKGNFIVSIILLLFVFVLSNWIVERKERATTVRSGQSM